MSKIVEAAGYDPWERKLMGITAMTSMLGKKKFEELLGSRFLIQGNDITRKKLRVCFPRDRTGHLNRFADWLFKGGYIHTNSIDTVSELRYTINADTVSAL